MTPDDISGRPGKAAFVQTGTGHPATKNCMPCGRNVLKQVGGGNMAWRGMRAVWHCPDCKAKRLARAAEKAAA